MNNDEKIIIWLYAGAIILISYLSIPLALGLIGYGVILTGFTINRKICELVSKKDK